MKAILKMPLNVFHKCERIFINRAREHTSLSSGFRQGGWSREDQLLQLGWTTSPAAALAAHKVPSEVAHRLTERTPDKLGFGHLG